MGRLIALTLIFYIAFTFSRFLIKLFTGSWIKPADKRKDKSEVPPWHTDEIEDADFEELE